MSLSIRLIALLAALSLAGFGCGEVESPANNQSDPPNQGDGGAGDEEPDDPWAGWNPEFAAVGEVIQTTCALGGCHGNPTGLTQLDFQSASPELIKEVFETYTSSNGFSLITAGNADESDLYLSITSEDDTIRMPRPPLDPLDEAVVTRIRSWINDGAPYE